MDITKGVSLGIRLSYFVDDLDLNNVKSSPCIHINSTPNYLEITIITKMIENHFSSVDDDDPELSKQKSNPKLPHNLYFLSP